MTTAIPYKSVQGVHSDAWVLGSLPPTQGVHHDKSGSCKIMVGESTDPRRAGAAI